MVSKRDVNEIIYRQEIAKDIENEILANIIKNFAKKMITVRSYLALVSKLYYKYHKDGWYLEAIYTYCETVSKLSVKLSKFNLTSKGPISFREYLKNYIESREFINLFSEVRKIKSDLASIRYCIDGNV